MDNPIEYISTQLLSYFLRRDAAAAENTPIHLRGLDFIKFHKDKLAQNGDISLARNLENWINFCRRHDQELRDEIIELLRTAPGEARAEAAFLANSIKWLMPLERMQALPNDRYALYFKREAMKRIVLRLALFGSGIDGLPYGYVKKKPTSLMCIIEEICVSAETLLGYRCHLLRGILQRIVTRSSWTSITEDDDNSEHPHVLRIHVQSASMAKRTSDDGRNNVSVIVGPVLEPKTRKLTNMPTDEYVALRSNDMLLIALHKFGIRSNPHTHIKSLASQVGVAAVAVDLFEVRPSSPVLLIRCGMGSTKGVSFILYNSARLESLLRTYNDRVQANTMVPLPAYDDVDLSVLREEDEWQLIYGYILHYPNLIERCIEHLERGECGVHLLVQYVNGLVATFSGYYRRSQILIQRPNLLPVMHARMYLIKAVRQVLNDALELLGIQPAQYM